MFHVPNKYRNNTVPGLESDNSFGNAGLFIIPHYKVIGYEIVTIASDGMDWEHVSVTIAEKRKRPKRCPTWEEMCFVKNLFWDETDCVIEFHPSKSEYVNLEPFALHLWRPIKQIIPIPNKIMV